MNLLWHAHITKTTTNKTKMTKNDCGGIMGKSKQVAICEKSCSAVQIGGQDKTGLVWPEPVLSNRTCQFKELYNHRSFRLKGLLFSILANAL